MLSETYSYTLIYNAEDVNKFVYHILSDFTGPRAKKNEVVDFVGANDKTDRRLVEKNAKLFYELLNRFNFPFTIIVEDYYIDKVYRDSYYMYYSGKHFSVDRFCERLSFFDGIITATDFFDKNKHSKLTGDYIGSIVLRPIRGKEIGRTLINPEKLKKDNENKRSVYVRTSKYTNTIYGVKFVINAFPYCTQDGETTKCAEIDILNILDYYSQHYQDYGIALPSDIKSLEKDFSDERVLPTRALTAYMQSLILSNFGFHPRHYSMETIDNDQLVFKRYLYYYVESGIPVVIGLQKAGEKGDGHSVICIGHEGNENTRKYYKNRYTNYHSVSTGNRIIDASEFCNYFVIMDEARQPYSVKLYKDICRDMKVHDFTVPLHKRMSLDAAAASCIVDGLLNDVFTLDKFAVEMKNEYVVKRLFLTSGKAYKNFKINNLNENQASLLQIYAHLPLSHFVWVCELYTLDDFTASDQTCFGELILDATAAPDITIDSLILIRIQRNLTFRYPDDTFEDMLDIIENGIINCKDVKCKGYNQNLSSYDNFGIDYFV